VTFFVDANPILYAAVEGPARDNCLRILNAIASGQASGQTSPVVLQEVWHVAVRQYGGLDGLVGDVLEVFSPLLPVTEEALVHALAMPDSRLGPNDRLHVGTCATHEIDTVITADRAFEGVEGIRIVDPFDDAAVDGLLAVAA
jgi:predicted nucleic acid-binding protein